MTRDEFIDEVQKVCDEFLPQYTKVYWAANQPSMTVAHVDTVGIIDWRERSHIDIKTRVIDYYRQHLLDQIAILENKVNANIS